MMAVRIERPRNTERPFADAFEREAARRGWITADPTWRGYRSKQEKHPRNYDLMGCIDRLAAHEGTTYAVQFTSKANVRARERKILRNWAARDFMLVAGWRVLVMGFQDGELVYENDLTGEL